MNLDFGASTTTDDHKQELCKDCTAARQVAAKGQRYRATKEGRVTTIMGGLTYRTKQVHGDMKITRDELATLLRKRTCVYCGRRFQKATKELNRVIDHVVPLAKGGGTVAGNLVASCWRCNHERGDKLVEEWKDRWYEKGD